MCSPEWYSKLFQLICLQNVNISLHCFVGDTSSTPIAADDDMDCTAKAKNYSSKTKRDEHGTYPAWMSKRKIESLKSKPKNKTTKNIDGSSGRVCKKRRLSKGKRK